MIKYKLPIITAPLEIVAGLEHLCSQTSALDSLESLAREHALGTLPLVSSEKWALFSADVRKVFLENDYVIIRGLPVSDHGATLLVTASTICSNYRTYRGGQIIKHFKMTPWTKELSHTIREGEFHTDLNTEDKPPAITAMQCLDPDPGAPQYGISRVARLTDVLSLLMQADTKKTLDFLTGDTVTMLNDRSSSSWSGHIVEKNLIRYHPETLRAAELRFGKSNAELNTRINELSEAAVQVSEPFILEQGDVLLLSNHRTLHYRGECSIVFKKYPTEFVSRSIFILHANQEMLGS